MFSGHIQQNRHFLENSHNQLILGKKIFFFSFKFIFSENWTCMPNFIHFYECFGKKRKIADFSPLCQLVNLMNIVHKLFYRLVFALWNFEETQKLMISPTVHYKPANGLALENQRPKMQLCDCIIATITLLLLVNIYFCEPVLLISIAPFVHFLESNRRFKFEAKFFMSHFWSTSDKKKIKLALFAQIISI